MICGAAIFTTIKNTTAVFLAKSEYDTAIVVFLSDALKSQV